MTKARRKIVYDCVTNYRYISAIIAIVFALYKSSRIQSPARNPLLSEQSLHTSVLSLRLPLFLLSSSNLFIILNYQYMNTLLWINEGNILPWYITLPFLGKGQANKTDEFSETFQRGWGGRSFSIQKFTLHILDF